MQVDLVLKVILAVCAGLTVLMFVSGVAAGIRTQDVERSGRRLGIAVVVLAGVLVVATLPLAWKFGSVITMVMTYVACALGAALLGGYGTGRKRSKGLVSGMILYLVVTGGVTSLALASMMTSLDKIGAIAQELGVGRQKYDPKADKSCTENLQSLYFAFGKYVEYNDSLPPAEKWQDQDDFKGAVQKEEWLHCPAVSNRHDGKFGYAYNAALSGRKLKGKKLNEMPDAAKTPLLFDSTALEKNAKDDFKSLPKPGRHGGKNNVLFCDGHIESIAP